MRVFRAIFFIFLFSLNINAQSTVKFIPFKKGDKYGYCDKDKNVVLPIQFENAYPFGYRSVFSYNVDLACVQIDCESYIINSKGEVIDTMEDFDQKEIEQDFVFPGTEKLKTVNFYVFEENGLKGVKEENEKLIVDAQFENIDIYKFSNTYQNSDTKRYYNPTYISTYVKGESSIIRLDKLTYYNDYHLRQFNIGSDFMIIDTKDKISGILFEDSVKLLDPQYTKIHDYYPENQLIKVSKIVENHPYDFYIDFEGIEYYE